MSNEETQLTKTDPQMNNMLAGLDQQNPKVQKLVLEHQLAVQTARQNPRDQEDARRNILMACSRPAFAEVALYSFPRSGQTIMGPSIRMAEVLLREWGNIRTNVELEPDGDYTTITVSCTDLQSNVRYARTFQVKNVRDTRKGPQPLTSERDIYENAMAQASRRLRAVILQTLPKWLVDEAVHRVKTTMADLEDTTVEQVADKLAQAFEVKGVPRRALERWAGGGLNGITLDQLVELRAIYTSVKDGAPPSQYFDLSGTQNNRASALQKRLTGGGEGGNDA